MASAVALAVLVAAASVLRHLGRVVDGDKQEILGVPQDSVYRKRASFRDLLMKALHLTAIRIVAVVWEIFIQVCEVVLAAETTIGIR